MPLYKSPIRPYDPVLPEQGTTVFQYLRDNFYGAGQDSFTRPFGQNQELFQGLQNVMPIAQGALRLRFGYRLFNNPAIGAVNRMYSYQNIASDVRKLVMISGTTVDACNEDGTGVSNILTTNASGVRMVNSRDYALFPASVATTTWPSGQQTDGKKWHSVNGLSDLGLAEPSGAVNVTATGVAGNITLTSTAGRVYAGSFLNSTTGHYSDLNVGVGSFASNTVGPNSPATVIQTSTGNISWANPTNVEASDSTDASITMAAAGGLTETLLITNFGFAIPGSGTISGIQASIRKHATSQAPFVTDNVVQLIKGGAQQGTNNAASFDWTASYTTSNYGGSSNLWGLTLTPADVNAANFGVAVQVKGNAAFGGINFGIDYVSITITYATGAGANTGTITSKQVSLSLPVTNPPTGVDKFAILATLDGGDTNTFYLLDTVPIAQSTYTDNTPDNVLATKNRATEVDDLGVEHGLVDSQPPPLGLQFPIKHRGRIYGAIGEILWFSKNLDEITTSTGLVVGRFEEAWPPTYNLNVSPDKESIRGLQSDGSTLYMGTERRVWRLDGDGPLNFSKPEVIFNEVGVLNQDVWQVVFAEGTPVGTIWFTPDNRVIMSNFAHYQDIGTPIQDVLNTFNGTLAWAQFYSQNAFDVYILAFSTGANTNADTLCVYDLRASRWSVWNCADKFSNGLFNINLSGTPQWLMAADTGKVYNFIGTATQDRVNDTPVAITAKITTPWMHLGQPTMVKALNEIEVITGDANLTVTVNGASTQTQTSSPNVVVSNAGLVLSPRGFYKVYLAGNTTKDRFYQFVFTSTGGVADVLLGYTIEAFPVPY